MQIQLGFFPQVLLLVLARVAAVIGTVPFFGGSRISPTLRVIMALMIALAILPVVPAGWINAASQIHTPPQMLFAILSEVLLGVAVGLICNTFVAACTIAGTIIARGSSLMMARSIDPIGGAQNPIVSQMLQMVFIVLVLLGSGHLVLLKLIAMSFRSSPEPMCWLQADFFCLVLSLGSTMFQWGLKLALPVMCASLIINVCFGLIARMASDFNILFLSLPIRLLTGLSVCGFVLRFAAEPFGRMLEQMLAQCAGVLGWQG